MLSNGGPSAMGSWPLDWKYDCITLEPVLEGLVSLGCTVWQGGQALAPAPFGLGRFGCRVEAWQPGLVFRFKDDLPPAVIAWADWEQARSLAGSPVVEPAGILADLLLAASHPLRFSPYNSAGPGEGLFVGREAELSLLLSPLPSLVVAGAEGMGKSSLFLRGARQAGTRVISGQAMSALELEAQLDLMLQRGEMPLVLFLDEMDGLFHDVRARPLLEKLNRRGIAWRAAVHKECPGLGPTIRLGAPRLLDSLLYPLEKISGGVLPLQVKRALLDEAAGNPRRLRRLCRLALELMGDTRWEVTGELAVAAVKRARLDWNFTNPADVV